MSVTLNSADETLEEPQSKKVKLETDDNVKNEPLV